MSYTFPTDQHRLAKILKLDRYQFAEGSILHSLMESQAEYDIQENIDTVSLTLADMAAYEALYSQYLLSQGQQGQTSVTVSGEYSVSYSNTIQSTYGPRMAEIVTRIRKYLDPHDYLAERGQSRPRVT